MQWWELKLRHLCLLKLPSHLQPSGAGVWVRGSFGLWETDSVSETVPMTDSHPAFALLSKAANFFNKRSPKFIRHLLRPDYGQKI